VKARGKSMPTLEYDLGYLQAACSILGDYLLSADLYWSIGNSPRRGEPPYPSLTLGGVLLAQARAHARPASGRLNEQIAQADEQINAVRQRWRSAWGRKAARDFHARLNLWRDFLEEYRQNPEANLDRYAYEVSRRVMSHLLESEAGEIPKAEIELLVGLDRLLRIVLIPGGFVWEKKLAPGFPQEVYWYLYGKLKG